MILIKSLLLSPDVICRDHDLSIYTVNFHESGHGPSEKSNSLIWEGHGLLSWIMDQSKDELFVRGKLGESDVSIDVYIELQPVRNSILSRHTHIKRLNHRLDYEMDQRRLFFCLEKSVI